MPHKRSLDRILWAGQWVLAIAFEVIGLVKLGLRARHFEFAAGATTGMLHASGTLEVLLSLLVILPALTGLLPRLSIAAAAGLGAIALLGTAEPSTALGSGAVIINVALAGVAAFVAWGRFSLAPFALADEEDAETAGPGSIEQAPSYP